MQERQANKPVRLNTDVSKKYLPPDTAFFLLNHERNVTGEKTLGKFTPMPSNYQACVMEPVAGTPYSVGTFRDSITNEVYSWTLNDGGINYILRVNSEGVCQVVYNGGNDCLPLSADPKHAIEQWRAYLKYDKLCAHRHGKQLVWTDGLNDIGMLDVEASIATNSFTTAFFDICTDDCAMTTMCIPYECGLLQGEFIPLVADQADLTNHTLDVALQLCYRFIYYDDRVSEFMGMSEIFYQNSRGCFEITEGFPRCIKFRVPVGNPMVDRIEIAVRRDNELWTDGLSPLWRSVEVVEKYKPYSSQGEYWYEREISADLLNFSTVDCSFDYIFCNDKQCSPISIDETNRVYNPIPREAQGLLRLKDSLGFYNYKSGVCPLSGTETEKFEISLQCNSVNTCNPDLVDIVVNTIVYNSENSKNAFIYRLGGTSEDEPDDVKDKARFGRVSQANDGYQQFFKNKTRNFIAYIEGTEYWAEMEQWEAQGNYVAPFKKGLISGVGQAPIINAVIDRIDNGYFYFQKATLRVPKGTRGFIRIASHEATNGTDSNQDTSTFVLGTIANLTSYNGATNLSGVISASEEIYFDTCSGGVVIDEAFVINDNYKNFYTGSHSSSAYYGYITDSNNKPVEYAEIYREGALKCVTDHNGFYHFYLYSGINGVINTEVKVEQGCVGGFTTVKVVSINGGYGLTKMNIQITEANAPGYATNFYEIVSVTVRDCNNIGVGGLRVALSGSKYQVSDVSTGAATFHVRNKSARNRIIRGIILNHNNCFTLDCNGDCNPCSPITALTSLSPCFIGTPYLTVATTTKLNQNTSDDTKRGLKAGGRYPFGIVAQWGCGKISAVYPVTILTGSLAVLDNYLDIPKTQDKGFLSFCNINYRGNGITLPQGVNCLRIVRGENVNDYELQWVVDKVERTADGKIKLTIQSLNDYNAQYNFETNTVYQYQKNDRVEFISNGDGTPFDIATNGLLNYQLLSPFHDKIISGQANAPANYFNQILIDDDDKLGGLIEGAKIEIQRQRSCTVEPTYKEIYSIPVDVNGHLEVNSATFSTYDTFFVNRKIGSKPDQIFEHHAPSDHWGNRISDGGKVHFVNRYENEQRFGRNISFNSAIRFNIFGYLVKTLDSPEQGDLTSMGVYDGKMGLGIAEHDNFIFQVSDDFLRVGNDGVVRASDPDSLISDAQPKLSGIYGCQYPHIGSIYYGDGFVTYWDVNKSAYIKHDFNMAKDVSEGKMANYFDSKGQFMENFNKTATTDIQKYRPITGFNFNTKSVQFTIKALNQGGVNNNQAFYELSNETILFHPVSEDFLTAAAYTPERYSNLDLYDGNGCAFVSFLHGIPFIHPKIAVGGSYNEFFGIATDWVVAMSMNIHPEKIKVPISYEVESEDMWFISKVTTDKAGFESEVPPRRVKKTERKWNASFLFDKNSRGGLFGVSKTVAGTQARGYFVACIFVRNNTLNLVYNSIDTTKQKAFGELDMIIFKMNYSEQSGYTENL